MSQEKLLENKNVPIHIAIIMDGNGRWAVSRGKKRTFGHKKGVLSVKKTIEVALETGIKYLTLFVFSVENWKRPQVEIKALMSLLQLSISSEIDSLQSNNVRLLVLGNMDSLPAKVQKKINDAVERTSINTGLTLTLALNYSAKQDIILATKHILNDIFENKIKISDISENLFSKYLSTSNIPRPDLLIRTSGEYRLSNFLLWELAYTELYFTETLWPDFDKKDFYIALINYQKRKRRFGEISEQINNYEV